MAKKRCSNCGEVIGEEAAFCIFCGERVEPEQSPKPSQPQPGSTSRMPMAQWPTTPHQASQAQQRPVYSAQSTPPSQIQFQQNNASKPPIPVIIGIAAAAIVILALVMVFVVLPSCSGVSKPVQNTAPSVASSNAASVQGETPPRFSSVEVSSQLPGDNDTADYGPGNLTDGNPATAWNEGAAGFGVGEWVKFSAVNPQRVTSVSIMGGFPKFYKDGSDVYKKNPRPREITISYEGGSQGFTMQDVREQFQTFTLSKPVDTRWITITIDSVYPGTRYEDCCIAEVKFQ